MQTRLFFIQFITGVVFGSIIACSPSKFTQTTIAVNLCDASVTSCVSQNGFVDITQDFKVGSGKVDILFVTDNSASMSKNQLLMSMRFSGFIANLDSKGIDYRIAMATTDLDSVMQNNLVSFSNGKKYITNSDSNRVSLFNNAIVRNETIVCENYIIGMFNTFGILYQYQGEYFNQYYLKCPSPDTRGIYTARVVVSENREGFIRGDANLNIILISNNNVRPGKTPESNDTANEFVNMMQSQHPNKYWDFNSIVVKDTTCLTNQILRNAINQVVSNSTGPSVFGGLGIEYANLSNSAALDIDNNPRPRGKVLDICQQDYSQHFNTMSTQILDEARMFTMKCTPDSAPIVTSSSNNSVSHTWTGNKIIFARSLAGTPVTVKYKCYTGPT